jgi:hypothetical protein
MKSSRGCYSLISECRKLKISVFGLPLIAYCSCRTLAYFFMLTAWGTQGHPPTLVMAVLHLLSYDMNVLQKKRMYACKDGKHRRMLYVNSSV